MDFNTQYNIYLKSIEEKINEYFKVPNIPQKSVFEAMRYAITGGGKRLRPVLVMAVADMFGADEQEAAAVGTSIECIHNYSLIHDDLPCMDDDDLRRGRPTCHKAFGESTALLAGDGLLNMAFEILSDADRFKSINLKSLLSIVKKVSSSSGVYGMIGGQIVDLENEMRTDVTLDELKYMHQGKTGALIRCSAVCGCLCANLDESDERIAQIEKFAENLGLAFQIKDDILDVIGDEELLGKPIGSDEKSGKNTYVSLLGMSKAEEHLREATKDAKACLKVFGERAWFLNELADILVGRAY